MALAACYVAYMRQLRSHPVITTITLMTAQMALNATDERTLGLIGNQSLGCNSYMHTHTCADPSSKKWQPLTQHCACRVSCWPDKQAGRQAQTDKIASQHSAKVGVIFLTPPHV